MVGARMPYLRVVTAGCRQLGAARDPCPPRGPGLPVRANPLPGIDHKIGLLLTWVDNLRITLLRLVSQSFYNFANYRGKSVIKRASKLDEERHQGYSIWAFAQIYLLTKLSLLLGAGGTAVSNLWRFKYAQCDRVLGWPEAGRGGPASGVGRSEATRWWRGQPSAWCSAS
jgi:hypothetical protein